jgi:phosphohistidine phosphatase SixA
MPARPFLNSAFTALLICAVFLAGTGRAANSASESALWEAVRTGTAFAIMRHALAPGTGDPRTVVPDDCTTQRNLSERGREQARRIGNTFRRNGISAAQLFASAWCRCVDTATLLDIGDVKTLPDLNSFFVTMDRSDAQTAALSVWIAAYKGNAPLVLVTHQVNITALTDVYPRSGEIVVARRDDNGNIRVLGTLYSPEWERD